MVFLTIEVGDKSGSIIEQQNTHPFTAKHFSTLSRSRWSVEVYICINQQKDEWIMWEKVDKPNGSSQLVHKAIT